MAPPLSVSSLALRLCCCRGYLNPIDNSKLKCRKVQHMTAKTKRAEPAAAGHCNCSDTDTNTYTAAAADTDTLADTRLQILSAASIECNAAHCGRSTFHWTSVRLSLCVCRV